MSIPTIKVEVKRITRFLQSGNIKAAERILLTATPGHKALVRSMLDPQTEKLFDDNISLSR